MSAVIQEIDELVQGLRAVADAILFRRVELGRGLAKRGQIEQRIVTEAVRPARRARDLAAPDAFGDEGARIVSVAQEQHPAVIVSPALLSQAGQQLLVIARIALLARTFATCVIRRMHPGLAVERLHAQPRIIGERGQARRPARVPRLGKGVFEKGRVRLVGFRDAESRLRHELDRERRQQSADFPPLAGIARRKDQLHSASAFFCKPMSCVMPRWASARSESSSWRENGSPSAVPFTSTKPPWPVITTFMSQPQAESSA